MSARILPGTLRQQALLQAVVRSMAGHTRDEVERLVGALLPEVMAHLEPAMLGRQRRHGNLHAYTVLSECPVAS